MNGYQNETTTTKRQQHAKTPPLVIPLLSLRAIVTYLPRECLVRASRFIAEVLVASQDILLQTFVAEYPPKTVTNQVFSIHNHVVRACDCQAVAKHSQLELISSVSKNGFWSA